ncbi:hypothetical protein Btru_013508 [Bulinus truncatus]|nr:hypothetical protein Btru_013508 [Bulinus truncatus]
MALRLELKDLLILGFFLGLSTASKNETMCCQNIHPGDYDAFWDAEHNILKTHPDITVHSPFSGAGCSSAGVFKITIPPKDVTRRRVLIDFILNNPTGWVYHIGDSSTNDGYGGDAGTQSRDAEFHLYGTISGYFGDGKSNSLAFGHASNVKTRASYIIGDETQVWYYDCDPFTANYFHDPDYFALSGQPDEEGPVNYDILVGINRVIGNPEQFGAGACAVGFRSLTVESSRRGKCHVCKKQRDRENKMATWNEIK